MSTQTQLDNGRWVNAQPMPYYKDTRPTIIKIWHCLRVLFICLSRGEKRKNQALKQVDHDADTWVVPVEPGIGECKATCKFSMQWWPNIVRKQWRICLSRICWDIGTPGISPGYSCKFSLSLCFRPREFWIGIRTEKTTLDWDKFVFINLLPTIQIRLHLKYAYGGSFVSQL